MKIPPRTSQTSPTSWRLQGACRTHDEPDTWFPAGNSGEARAQAAEAKRICNVCPVRLDCGRWALDNGEAWGVWGGLTENERRAVLRIRRARKAAEAPQPKQEKPAPMTREPAKCGTRGGYQRHLREKTEICTPCRQANTDADNRLRRTGTTKQLAA